MKRTLSKYPEMRPYQWNTVGHWKPCQFSNVQKATVVSKVRWTKRKDERGRWERERIDTDRTTRERMHKREKHRDTILLIDW